MGDLDEIDAAMRRTIVTEGRGDFDAGYCLCGDPACTTQFCRQTTSVMPGVRCGLPFGHDGDFHEARNAAGESVRWHRMCPK